ncbi:MAG: tetratricopeptide repeat protein [Planctomycetia bacterium]|nr:tetratricopeptide repeat protein [Planctomycetia bacterium]
MRALVGLWLIITCVTTQAANLKEARTRWLKGNYEEAQEQYEELLKDAKLRGPASIGLSRTLESQGLYDKAQEVIDKAAKEFPKDADVQARLAELYHMRGRLDDAEKAADTAIGQQEAHLPARWIRARVYAERGDIKKADAEHLAILRAYNNSLDTPNAIKDSDWLLVVALASAENARWKGIADEFQTILEDLLGDSIKAEPAFWPAELHAGLLLLEKYNRGEALDAFDKALKINPSAAEVLVARGFAAVQRFEFKEAESFAERALKINPNLPDALRLRADVHFATGDTTSALKELDTALKINPRDERTLARVAGCRLIAQQKKEYEAVVAQVNGNSKSPSTFYLEMAELVEQRRRYDLSEEFYRRAMKLRPELSGPLNGLGMLLLRLGNEKEGRELLEKGFKSDRFNVRVSNMRKVMAHLDGYQEIKTKHFTLKYDQKSDPILARYMAYYLEQIYDELAIKFDYRPEGPFAIELFRNHTMFSGRTVGLPDLHTIGACTGRVVTMVSPNERDARGEKARSPFNWARVLRHEVVHVFNLAQTNYLLPHWFTEGLAVANEGNPRPPSWDKMLMERVPAGKLLNLDTIDLGFIRPRDPMEWQLAYCQANLYIEYIELKHGKDNIGKMLAAFAKGSSTTQAVKDVLKVEKADFEKGYKTFLDELVAKLRGKKATEKRRTLDELQAEYKKNPADPDVAAELALRWLGTKRAEARKLAGAALEQKNKHPKALFVLAQLAMRAADEKQARKLLEEGLSRDDPEPMIAKALGKLYYEAGDVAKAIDAFELGRKADPADKEYLVELSRAYAQQGNKNQLIDVLEELVPNDADDFDRRLRLARLCQEEGKLDKAEKYARQALEIDVTSAEAKKILIASLEKQKKTEEARKLDELLTPMEKGK